MRLLRLPCVLAVIGTAPWSLRTCQPTSTGPYRGGLSPTHLRAVTVIPVSGLVIAAGTSAGWRHGFICVHDVRTGKVQWFRDDLRAQVMTVAAPSAQRRFASGDSSGMVTIWDVDPRGQATAVATLKLDCQVQSLAWADHNRLVAGLLDGSIALLATDPLRVQSQSRLHRGRVSTLAVRRGSLLAASGSWDGVVKVFRTDTLDVMFVMQGKGIVRRVEWDRQGKSLAAVFSHAQPTSQDGQARASVQSEILVYKTEGWRKIYGYRSRGVALLSASFDCANGLTVTELALVRSNGGFSDGTARTWYVDLGTGKLSPVSWQLRGRRFYYVSSCQAILCWADPAHLCLYNVSGDQLRLVWEAGIE